MAEQESKTLKEFEPLSKLLVKVPHKLQKGLFTQEYIEWTSVDVDSCFVAIGTNVGITYLVDRTNGQLQKLQCKTRNVAVTMVKLCHNVDYLVAVGTFRGQLFIFQLPSILPGRKKQLHLYEVVDLHYRQITSFVWSQNSAKLYSGDCSGLVTCTEFNYDNETSKSYTVLTEPHGIVQLDYTSRILLVSTKFRTVLYNTLEKRQIQVGTKERKIQGAFGAVFIPGGVYYQPQEMVLFAVRPGLRLWKACSDGSVKTTFLFKDLVTRLNEGIELLDDSVRVRSNTKLEDMQFGPLLMYMDTYLVTFHEGCLFVIDPGLGNFYGYHTGLSTIKGVAVCDDEIFILSSHQGRELIRMAQKPIPGNQPDKGTFSEELTPSPLHSVTATAEKVSQSIVGAFKEMGGKFQDAIIEGQIVPGPPSKDPPWGSTKTAPTASSQSVEQPTSVVVVGKNIEVSEPDTSSTGEIALGTIKAIQNVHIGATSSEQDRTSPREQETEPGSSLHHTASDVEASSDIAPGGPEWCKDVEVVHPGAPPLIEIDTESDVARPKQFREESLAFVESEMDSIAVPAKPKKKGGKKKMKVTTDKDSISISSTDLQQSSVSAINRSNTPSPLPDTVDISTPSMDVAVKQDINETTFDSPDTAGDTDNYSEPLDLQTPLVTFQSRTPDIEKLRKLESELTALPWEQETEETCKNETFELGDRSETLLFYTENVVAETNAVLKSSLGFPDVKENTTDVSSHIEHQSDSKGESTGLDAKYAYKEEGESLMCNGAHVHSSQRFSQEVQNKHSDLDLDLDLDLKEERVDSSEQTSRDSEKSGRAGKPGEEVDRSLSLQTESREGDSSEEMFSIYDTGVMSPKSPESSSSSVSQLLADSSIEDVLTYSNAKEKLKEGKPDTEKSAQRTSQKRVGFMDAWTMMLAPGNLQCLCVAERIVWVVDKSDRIHWSFLSGSTLKWHKLEVSAQQISVSPSGSIVWRLYNGKVFAGTKITTRAPAGLKWEDFVQKDVVSISVDEHMGWYVKSTGEVVMHKKLTRERPCFKPQSVPCDFNIVMVVCRQNVVWCLTRDRNILVRTGVTSTTEEGIGWRYLDGAGLGLMVSKYDLGLDGTAWIVDVVGRLWFTTEVTQDTPQGSGDWWQVPLTAYLMQDVVANETMKAIAEKPGELNRLRKKEDMGGLVAARCNGIWLCPGFKNVLHLCCSNLEGHWWDIVHLQKIVSSTMKWLHISARGVTDKNGLLWAQQPNGYIFCFRPGKDVGSVSSQVSEVGPPEPGSGQPLVCLSVCESVVWTLTIKGSIWLRTGIRPSCPHGVNWVSLDMQQLAGAKLLYLSAGTQNVWAVDARGHVYLRIGTEAPSAHCLNQAWVPVEGTTDTSNSKFEKIYVGPNDWMVWALDSQDKVYTRKGVTDSMPIGTHWVSVPGEQLKQLCVGEQYVYGLNSIGEVLVRDGIKEANPKGTYWHKIPGCLSTLSASRDGDLLWGVDLQGQIVRRFSQHLHLKEALSHLVRVSERAEDVEGDWELL